MYHIILLIFARLLHMEPSLIWFCRICLACQPLLSAKFYLLLTTTMYEGGLGGVQIEANPTLGPQDHFGDATEIAWEEHTQSQRGRKFKTKMFAKVDHKTLSMGLQCDKPGLTSRTTNLCHCFGTRAL